MARGAPPVGYRCGTSFFRARATGRMEFSASLVLSSNLGYSKKRVSFFRSPSAYRQALLSALEGKAADCIAGAAPLSGLPVIRPESTPNAEITSYYPTRTDPAVEGGSSSTAD